MSAPTLALSTDKAIYNVGETITVTAAYTDTKTQSTPLILSGTASDPEGNTVTATVTVTVNSQVPEHMDVVVTDSASHTYTKTSDTPGVTVFTATA